MRVRTMLLLVLLAGLASAAPAQGPSQPQSSAQLAGEGAVNLLNFAVGVTSEYDDNLSNSATNNQAEATFAFMPRVQWNVSRNHLIWGLDYAAVEGRSATASYYRRTSHVLGMQVQYQLSPRLTLLAANTFTKSSDPYYQPLQSRFVNDPGVTERANSSIFSSGGRTIEQVTANANYRLTARSDISIGGAFSALFYDSTSTAALSRDTYVAMGHADFNHQFSARRSLGTSYSFEKITSTGGFYTVVHQASVFHNYKIGNSINLNIFAGPSHVESGFPLFGVFLVRTAAWSWSAGGSFHWSGARMGLTADAVRQVNDGGGLQGAVQLTSFGFSVTRQLTAKLRANIYGRYNLNDTTGAGFFRSGVDRSAQFGSGGASVVWQLKPHISITTAYSREESLLPVNLGGTDWRDRSRVTVSVNYSFSHRLGR
jgi:hypothetical protein